MVRLRTTDENIKRDVALANIHVTWSQFKYPALQALQVPVTSYSSLTPNVVSSKKMINRVRGRQPTCCHPRLKDMDSP